MLLTEITFTPNETGDRQRDALVDAVQGLFGSLIKNGQVWGEELHGWVDGRLRVVCWVPRFDALESKHHSVSVVGELARVEKFCERSFEWQVTDDRASTRTTEGWRAARELFLFTHMFDKTSPVCAGKCAPIPLYLLPISAKQREALYCWMWRYKEMDSVQIGCGPLEIAGYREMATPDSSLSKEGRELATAVETATGKPTFYYLFRYWGRREGEDQRLCPGCGNSWAQDRDGDDSGLGWFDFCCAPCRLVSHEATSFEDERHARIGEWRRK